MNTEQDADLEKILDVAHAIKLKRDREGNPHCMVMSYLNEAAFELYGDRWDDEEIRQLRWRAKQLIRDFVKSQTGRDII